MGPTVSILMPVRDGATTLEQALKSVAQQTYSDWELVVVDDHSSDGTGEILEQWGQRESRLRIISNPGVGLVAALNSGLSYCRGGLVARMDVDDVMHLARLEKQVGILHDQPNLGLVSCGVEFGGDRRQQAGYAAHVDWLNSVLTPGQIRRGRFVESPFAHPSVMFRRGLVSQYGGYDDGPWPEDYELWLRWLDAGVPMAKVRQVLLTWNDPPGRASRVDPRYDVEAFYRVKARYLAAELARSKAGRTVWIAGAGRPTRKRADMLTDHGVQIAGYLDVDPRKIGQRIQDRPVVGVEDLPPASGAVVLSYVGNRGARAKVRTLLESQGRIEGRDFWLCA